MFSCGGSLETFCCVAVAVRGADPGPPRNVEAVLNMIVFNTNIVKNFALLDKKTKQINDNVCHDNLSIIQCMRCLDFFDL